MSEIHDKQIQRIIKKHYIKHTQEIDLTDIATEQKYTEESCRRLFKFRDWSSLRVITLSFIDENQYSSKIVRILAEFNWPNLTQLHLSDNLITCEGLKFLTDMKLPRLKYIDLSFAKIKDEGMTTLIKKLQSDELQQLDLHRNQISWKGLKCVLKIEETKFQHLKFLNLNQNRVGSKGVKYLTKIALPVLASLHLNNCEVSNAGVKHICKSHWPVLQKLELRSNKFNVLAAVDLMIVGLPKLKILQIVQKCKKSKPWYDNNDFIMLMQLISADWTTLHLQKFMYLRPGYCLLSKMTDEVFKEKVIRCLM